MRDIVLRNFLAYGDARILDASTGHLSRWQRALVPMRGFFVKVRGGHLCVFKHQSALWIQYGETRIPWNSRVSILVRQGFDENTVTISVENIVTMQLRYIPGSDKPLPCDPAPLYVEPEDVDIGIWLQKITESPERQTILLSQWTGEERSDATGSQA